MKVYDLSPKGPTHPPAGPFFVNDYDIWHDLTAAKIPTILQSQQVFNIVKVHTSLYLQHA